MTLLSASQAAKAVGKSVPTITRAIKSGKLSAEKRDGGGWNIQPSELFRIWPAVKLESDATPPKLWHETPIETSVLQAKLEAAEQRLADKDDTIQDLRGRLDVEGEERRKLTAMITEQRQNASKTASEGPKGFLGWFRTGK